MVNFALSSTIFSPPPVLCRQDFFFPSSRSEGGQTGFMHSLTHATRYGRSDDVKCYNSFSFFFFLSKTWNLAGLPSSNDDPLFEFFFPLLAQSLRNPNGGFLIDWNCLKSPLRYFFFFRSARGTEEDVCTPGTHGRDWVKHGSAALQSLSLLSLLFSFRWCERSLDIARQLNK